MATLKIRSRSPKSNHLFLPSQQCIHASLVKIHPLVQEITHIPYFGQSKVPVTLKIWSRSPKSNQRFLHSQQCIHANLVKIHSLVQKITHKNKNMRMPTGSSPKTICPPPFGWGYIIEGVTATRCFGPFFIISRKTQKTKFVNSQTM